MNHGEVDHGFAVVGEAFVILDQPTIRHQPRERPLHHPTSRMNPETFGDCRRGRYRPTTDPTHPVDELPAEPTVGNDLTHSWQHVLELTEQPSTSVAVLLIGGCHPQRPDQTQRVHQNEPLATV